MQLPYSNLQITHQNPGATMPLILPVHVICNTSDDDIFSNIKINSLRPGEWQKLVAQHDGIAVLCGSGPSLADSIEEIKAAQDNGAKVFAMNGSANYLYKNGILADYQVIIDAQPETSNLVGEAKEHLFGSQVHPSCFDRAPNAKIWHLQIGGIEEHLPDYQDDYCLIGGAASVGNTSTCLAYAMGYRDLQIFGYDSSHKNDSSHAFHQKMNDGEPCASVMFNGKNYICSLTMKLQAEKFQETAVALIASGCTIKVHGYGILPDMYNHVPERISEKEKYTRMWKFPEYRIEAPCEKIAEKFIELTGVTNGDIVIDFGCGTGRGAQQINKLAGCEFILVDFVDNSIDPDLWHGGWFTRYRHDLTKPLLVKSQYGICTDVLEHIPPNDVDSVIKNIMAASTCVLFQVSLIDDNCGALIGQKLHLSVHSADWWKDEFLKSGFHIEYMESNDCEAVFLVYGKDKNTAIMRA